MKKVIYSGTANFALLPKSIVVNKEKKTLCLLFENVSESEIIEYVSVVTTEDIEVLISSGCVKMWLPMQNVVGIYNHG